MSNISKRTFLGIGLGAVAGAAGIGYAMTASTAAGFEHIAMTAEEIQSSGALVVDIRTPGEWRQTGVIEGAKLVEFDFDNPATFLPQIQAELADGRDLILICRSGNRTQAAARYLTGQIDNRIVSVRGGIRGVISGGYRPVAPG